MAVIHGGTPYGEIEPYRAGDRVDVWTPRGWVTAEVVLVRDKGLDLRFEDGHEAPVSKRRARLAR